MFRYVLRRRRRMTRTSSSSPGEGPRKARRWRRQLAWAALFTLVASALYFAVAGRTTSPEPVDIH
jgi:hypothetical protein